MSQSLAILEFIPTPEEFYAEFWNKRPFLVRQAVPKATIAGLIAADELAGLAMEEGPQTRLVETSGDFENWSCRFGPFGEKELTTLAETNWSLLIQNVEQFHPDTSALLACFNFAPRWMIDDIMVSLSAPGGSVGPHMDSYHVFLVQGQGSRRWKVGSSVIASATYMDNPDLKILDTPIQGDEVEVALGDVLYVPPHFAHQGTTLTTALTFSVGFLGPKMSELFGSYSQYLAELETTDQRYIGASLEPDSSGHIISNAVVREVRTRLADHLMSPDFADWLVAFFTEPLAVDFAEEEGEEGLLDKAALANALAQGATIYKPAYVKIAVILDDQGQTILGYCGQTCRIDDTQFAVVKRLIEGESVSLEQHPALQDDHVLELIVELSNFQAIEITSSDCEH